VTLLPETVYSSPQVPVSVAGLKIYLKLTSVPILSHVPPDVTERPNILLVCTDQQFAGAMSCAGTDHIDTPAIDSLADRGVRFTESYCANPVCSPSRASMFSGEPSHRTGVRDNRQHFDEDVHDRTLGHLLSDAGYECSYAGKWHVPYHNISGDHGFERIAGYNDHDVPEATEAFLRADHEDPFFLVSSFDNPHNICEWPRGETLPWGNVEVPPPEKCPPLPANFAIPPFEPVSIDDHRESMPMADATPEEWRQYRYVYYRLVERVDRALAGILQTLEDEGLAEETVVLFTSDHGDMNGAHRLHQKWVAYEESARVPLIVAGPETADDCTDDRLICNGYDLVPTLCDYAETDVPDGLRGYSLRAPARRDEPNEWRDYLVTESTGKFEARMVRTPRYKYTVYEEGRPREQLFDMQEDRGEMVNLAVDDAHEEVLNRHRELLLEWCVETNDRFMSHYAHGINHLPTVPGFEYEEIRGRFEDESDT